MRTIKLFKFSSLLCFVSLFNMPVFLKWWRSTSTSVQPPVAVFFVFWQQAQVWVPSRLSEAAGEVRTWSVYVARYNWVISHGSHRTQGLRWVQLCQLSWSHHTMILEDMASISMVLVCNLFSGVCKSMTSISLEGPRWHQIIQILLINSWSAIYEQTQGAHILIRD